MYQQETNNVKQIDRRRFKEIKTKTKNKDEKNEITRR